MAACGLSQALLFALCLLITLPVGSGLQSLVQRADASGEDRRWAEQGVAMVMLQASLELRMSPRGWGLHLTLVWVLIAMRPVAHAA
jgi:hypothetical protein